MRRILTLTAAAALAAAACTTTGIADPTTPPTTAVPSAAGVATDDTMTDDPTIDDAMTEDEAAPSPGAGHDDTAAARAETVGVFTVPDGADAPGPALPGEAYSFEISAAPGDRLSFATMVVESNDLILATPPSGIPLYDGDTPIDGDVTTLLAIWDVGTEADEPLGEGPNQAPRQPGPDSGDPDPDATVRMVGPERGLPPMAELAAVVVAASGDGTFTVTILNASDRSMGLQTPFAPGIFVVHAGGEPLFTEGETDRGDGLEALAEDGNPAPLAATLEARG